MALDVKDIEAMKVDLDEAIQDSVQKLLDDFFAKTGVSVNEARVMIAEIESIDSVDRFVCYADADIGS